MINLLQIALIIIFAGFAIFIPSEYKYAFGFVAGTIVMIINNFK